MAASARIRSLLISVVLKLPGYLSIFPRISMIKRMFKDFIYN